MTPSAPPVDLKSVEGVSDLLVRQGLMSPAQRREVIAHASSQRGKLLKERKDEFVRGRGRRGKTLIEVGPSEVIASFDLPLPGETSRKLTEDRVTEAVARAAGVPYRKIDPVKLDAKAATQLISGPFARRHLILPLEVEEKRVTVAVADPFDRDLFETLKQVTGRSIDVVLSSRSDLIRIINDFYGFRSSVAAAAKEAGPQVDLSNLEQYVKMKSMGEIDPSDQPIINAVWYLLQYAFDQRASDIHMEPKRDNAIVRLRIDGVLHPVHSIPKIVEPAMVSRLKTLGRMDIAEKRRPQDGRIKTAFRDREIELRVSTLPVAFGEKVVVRIFDPQVLLGELTDLGFFERELDLFEGFLREPHGILLVTGPTGSGKTTTLYSALKALSTPEVNIVTIEDPIEMVCEEFNQVQVQPKIDVTFAAALRTILRQDPDIIMVGEIRDPETAANAIQAALTGHLVLSTLHTNDTSSAVTRMLDLGVEPFLLSSTLLGVVAQRLVRKVCPDCAHPVTLHPADLARLGVTAEAGASATGRMGEGCTNCRGTGYRGRSAIFEVMPLSDRIRTLVHDRADAGEIKKVSLQEGMMTLRDAAVRKVLDGSTTLDEVLSVTSEAS